MIEQISSEISTIFENVVKYIKNNSEFLITLISFSAPIIIGFGRLFLKKRKEKIESIKYIKNQLSDDEWYNLKHFYIHTKGQDNDPCDETEIKNTKNFNKKNLYNYFVKDIFLSNLKEKHYLVLADSGMGKSTLLYKLAICNNKKLKNKKIVLFSLSNELALEKLELIENKESTILLLDALDEDNKACENFERRMSEIINKTQDYNKIIITCRTQFFKNAKEEPEHIDLIRKGMKNKSMLFNKIYICPFDDKDIAKYLFKKYKFNIIIIIRAFSIVKKSPYLVARPMLLSYIEDLLDCKVDYITVSDIYRVLINKWIDREKISKDILIRFTYEIVLYLFKNDKLFITKEELQSKLTKKVFTYIDDNMARSRTLLNRTSDGKYKFAHKSIYEFLISDMAMDYKNIQYTLLDKIHKNLITETFYKDLCKKVLYENIVNNKSVKIKKENRFLLKLNSNNLIWKEYVLFNCDLSNMMFSRLNLSGLTFKNTCLRNTDLSYSNLKEVRLDNEKLVGAKLISADLRKAKLKRTDLTQADMMRANLKEADLGWSTLIETNFEAAILDNANLSWSNLNSTNLIKATLIEVNLCKAHLIKANLCETNLVKANLNGANLIKANLERAILTEADLKKADLREANLSRANLENANLMGQTYLGLI